MEKYSDRKKVLTIAGSDCSGGAGIQADLKTMTAHGVYGMSVITAITVQNTMGVLKSEELSSKLVAQQIDAVCSDIVPDAVKIGMLSNEDIICVVADRIKEYDLKNVVIDPVLISTSGRNLLQPEAVDMLVEKLLIYAKLITPNIPETETLTGMKINDKNSRVSCALELCRMSGAAVLVKGGHSDDKADDLLYFIEEGRPKEVWFYGDRIETENTHGTGCTLSSAIACNLALGYSLEQSVDNAKDYLRGALLAGLNIGHGNGPVDHCWKNVNIKTLH